MELRFKISKLGENLQKKIPKEMRSIKAIRGLIKFRRLLEVKQSRAAKSPCRKTKEMRSPVRT